MSAQWIAIGVVSGGIAGRAGWTAHEIGLDAGLVGTAHRRS